MREGYYLIYLRKSRADVEKERYGKYETLAIHERELIALAMREGYRVAETYRELVSGETIAKRTEFQKVMDRVQDKDCVGIIVHAVDRLGRGDPMEYGWILSTLRFTNTRIVTPGRVYDPNTADDIQQLKLQMFVSNIEFDHIRERLQRGAISSSERGNYIGSKPPYGYDKAVIDRNHTLVPNEHEADVVRTIFGLANDGMNKGAISRHLNSSGIKTRHGKIWSASRIGTILSNPVYKGYVRYGYRRQRIVSRDGMTFVKKTRVSDEGEYVYAKGVHEALVSEDDWARANAKAFEGVPVHRDRKIKNPLAGLIVCAKCGRALVRQDVKNKYGQHFPRLHHAYYTECQCKSISLAYVMRCLCSILVDMADDIELGSIETGANPEELRSIEAELRREDGRLDKLMELFYADAITLSEFKERRDASKELVERLRARHDELVARDIDATELTAKVREAVALLENDDVSAETKNDMLRGFVSKIEYEEIDRARKDRQISLTVRLRALDN